MSLTTLVDNKPVTLLDASPPQVHDSLDQRTQITLTIIDAHGDDPTQALHYEYGTPVSIVDSVAGPIFNGFVNEAVEKNIPPSPVNILTVNCFDNRYLADKRVARKEYINMTAGDIITDQLATYLAAEGVTASYASRNDATMNDFQVGTLLGLAAANNIGIGDLELAQQGTTASTTFAAGAHDFVTGASLTNIDANAPGQPPNIVNLNASSAIRFTGTCVGNTPSPLGVMYSYWEVYNDGATVISAGDTLQYDIWISSSSPDIVGGMDLMTTDASALRDYPNFTQAMHDQHFIKAHPGTNLKGYADDQWYHRVIDLTLMAGKTISHLDIAYEARVGGDYTSYYKNIYVRNSGGGIKISAYDGSISPYTPSNHSISANYLLKVNGFSNIVAQPVTAYDQIGTWISPPISINAAKIVRNSILSWLTVLPNGTIAASQAASNPAPLTPTGTLLTLYTSIDNQATWQIANFENPIAGLLPGFLISSRNLYVKAVFSTTGPSPELSPIMSTLVATVLSSWQQVKTDSITTAHTQADFNTGNFVNTAWYTAQNGANTVHFPSTDVGVTLNGFWEGWDRPDGHIVNETAYTTLATTNNYTWYRQLNMYAISGSDSRLRMINAPNLANFTAQLSVAIREDVSRESGVGFVYRTTNWNNANNTFAYSVTLEFNGDLGTSVSNPPIVRLLLGRGSNSGTTNSWTPIADVLLPFVPAVNTFYTLKVVANGSNHKVYVDDILWINVNDSTFLGAGGFGIRFYNATGFGYTGIFDDFGVVATSTGSWNNGNGIALNTGVGTVGDSIFLYDADVPTGGTLTALISLDNGASWQTALSGAAVPGLLPGMSVIGKSIRVQFLFASSTPIATPILKGWTIWVTKQTNATGSRVAPALALKNVGRAGATSVTWNALEPANTFIFIDTSKDGTAWTQIGSGASGSAEIAGITAQQRPIDDSFTSNTASFYSSTIATNGTVANWPYDTANSRIVASDGVKAQFLYNNLKHADIDLVTDMDTSDAGGVVWRVVDSNNFYDLIACDASSPTPNIVTLMVTRNNSRTTLKTATISWLRGIPHRIRVTMLGPVIKAYFDGILLFTYTDSFPLGAGSCGLRTDTVSGASAAIFYYLRIAPQGDSVMNMHIYTRVRLSSTDPTVTPQFLNLTTSVRSPDIQNGAFIPNTTFSVLNGSTNNIATNFDDLAKQSNYWWRIDGQRGYHFQPHDGTLAPFIITSTDIILPNSATNVKRAGDQYRNTPIILGGTDTLLLVKIFKTDGFSQTYTLDYPVDSLVAISDGVKNYTYGVKGVDAQRDFYFTQGNNTINQDASQLPLSPGLKVTFTYNGIVNVVAEFSRASEIAAQGKLESTSGIVEAAETAQGLNRAAASQLAASRETMYTAKPKTLLFATARAGLAVGQYLSIFLAQHGIIDEQFLITDCVTDFRFDNYKGVPDVTPYFTITATSGYIGNSWSTTLSGLGR